MVTICFYYGTSEWDGPRELFDILDIPEEFEDMKPFMTNYKSESGTGIRCGSGEFPDRSEADFQAPVDGVRREGNEEIYPGKIGGIQPYFL